MKMSIGLLIAIVLAGCSASAPPVARVHHAIYGRLPRCEVASGEECYTVTPIQMTPQQVERLKAGAISSPQLATESRPQP